MNASLIRPFILSVLGAVLIATGASAARPYQPTHPDPVLESWRWRTIPELRGVSVWTVAPDGKGNVWFGTGEGVWRSDGVHWRVFTTRDSLLSASCRALCVARDGSVYAGGMLGISRFRDGVWKRVFPPKGELRWFVNKITESSDGGLWAGTVWGALRLKGEEATLYTSAPVRDALRVIAPWLKFVTVPDEVIPIRPLPRGMGLRMAPVPSDTNESQVIYVAPGGPAEKAGLRVGDRISPGFPDLFGRASDTVTVTVRREGVVAPFHATLSQSQSEGQFRDFTFFEVYEDRNGGIWFGLDRGEIIRHFPGARESGEKAWRLYTGRDSLEIGFAPRFLQARDGSLWTISRHAMKGVNRFNGRSWERFRLISMGGDEANFAILETRDGTIWIGGRGTLHACRGGAWTVYRFPDVPIPSDVISGLAETPDGALWITGGGVTARLDFGMERWTTYEGLNFQGETPDGAQWFISRDEGGVRYDGKTWVRYGVEDGLMHYPCRLITTREGVVWAAGSHDATAATARLDGSRWTLQTHPRLGMSIESGFESADGSVWFGALYTSRRSLGGVLRYDGKTWMHYVPPDAPSVYVYDIGQSADGKMWFGWLNGLSRFDPSSGGKGGAKAWTSLTEPKSLLSTIHAVYGAPEGHLWVGGGGVFRFDGKQWASYDVRSGLAHEFIENFLQADDGSIYVATGRGISRFDGRTWTTQAVSPPGLRGRVLQSRDGALWISITPKTWIPRVMPDFPKGKDTSQEFRAIRIYPDKSPPETEVIVSLNRVSQPGNTALAWKGVDPWWDTSEGELQYAWRLDGGEWSPFSTQTNHIFEALPDGKHTFEVKARDRDFNEDPTPAVIRFTVVPPTWKQPWFIGLMVVGIGIIGLQASRIVAEQRRLHRANEDLKREIAERERAQEARRRLDAQLQEIRYLYRLRSFLGTARSPDEIIRIVGETLTDVLSESASGGAIVRLNDREWRFGETADDRPQTSDAPAHAQVGYERPLVWGGQTHGQLQVFCGVKLTESQERILLDETAGQIAGALEARELETQLLQSARLVSMGQMAAGVAHELNQPLGAISTTVGDIYLRLLDGLDLSKEELKDMMRDTSGIVKRMEEIISHLRIFSRDTSRAPGISFSVNESIRSSLKLIGAQLQDHGIDLKLELSKGLPPVLGHPHQMEQVFLNLLGNTRDALDEKAGYREPGTVDRKNQTSTGGGEGTDHGLPITNHESRGWEKRVMIRTRHEGEWVVAEVEDNGVGMDEASVGRVFDPFFTTKGADRGTGLGLSISYAIVRNHDGRITCESRKGEGTIFRVALPAAKEDGKPI